MFTSVVSPLFCPALLILHVLLDLHVLLPPHVLPVLLCSLLSDDNPGVQYELTPQFPPLQPHYTPP